MDNPFKSDDPTASPFKLPEPAGATTPTKTSEQLAAEKKAAEDAKAAHYAAEKAAKEAEVKQAEAKKDSEAAIAKGEEEKVKKAELKKECLNKAQAIMHEYGQESNIPLNHEYWGLMNQYRGL